MGRAYAERGSELILKTYNQKTGDEQKSTAGFFFFPLKIQPFLSYSFTNF